MGEAASDTTEHQHGGPPASDVEMTDRTRVEGGMTPTKAEVTYIKARKKEGRQVRRNQVGGENKKEVVTTIRVTEMLIALIHTNFSRASLVECGKLVGRQ